MVVIVGLVLYFGSALLAALVASFGKPRSPLFGFLAGLMLGGVLGLVLVSTVVWQDHHPKPASPLLA